MDLIYEYNMTTLAVHQSILEKYDLKITDFLGVQSMHSNGYFHIQNNYFNQMLLHIWPIKPDFDTKFNTENLEKYQVNDIAKSLQLKTFCNFNRMGYGKTVETCVYLQASGVKNVLIVAPKTVLEQWQQHIERWTSDLANVTYIVKSTEGLQKFLNIRPEKRCCLILNYEKLIQGPIRLILKNQVWDIVVFDEAHYLKNRNSKRTQAAWSIPLKHACLLTGTPIMSNYADLWSMLNVLGWRYSGLHYWPWVEKFCEVRDGFFGKEIVGPTRNERDHEHFKQYIDLISIRNPDLQLTKGKRIVTVSLKLEKPQRTLYNKIKKLTLDELPENLTIANGAVKCVRLRQATSCPHQLNPNEEKIMWGIKFEWIKNFVENTNEQVLILTQFAYTLKLLQEYLGDYRCAVHYGNLSEKQRMVELNEFKTCLRQVLIATTQSIGTGVDGLQEHCRLGIVIDADYSPEINAQAEDRLNRLGQSEPVVWYYLECEKTFDTRVRKINDMKNKSIRELIKEAEE